MNTFNNNAAHHPKYIDCKPFYSLNAFARNTFGHKLYKVTLNAGMTCPNRDGTCGTKGCIFCSASGSGDFAGSSALSVTEQINAGIRAVSRKRPSADKLGYIAYFQAFTNTYAPVERLREIYMEALSHPEIEVLSIATRPDCLPDDVLELLEECNRIKPVWIELGLQTIHEETSSFIRRGYPLPVFEKAVASLRQIGLDVIVHVIIGLPGETEADFLATIDYLNHMDIQGIKLHLLHILKGTDLADYYEANPFRLPDLQEYCQILGKAIANLRPDMVVHRITGDGPKDLLIAPLWTSSKRYVMNTILKYMKDQDIFQGKEYNHG